LGSCVDPVCVNPPYNLISFVATLKLIFEKLGWRRPAGRLSDGIEKLTPRSLPRLKWPGQYWPKVPTSGESVLEREKTKLPKTINVTSVGPALCVKGGVTRVAELIAAHLPDHICVRFIATFNRYTGYEGATRADRGSRLAQACVFLLAFVQTLFSAVARKTIFHVHFSGRGSLLRKGVICVMLRSLRCRYLVHSHTADTNPFFPWLPIAGRRLVLWGICGADRVIVLTRFWHNYYCSILNLPPERVLLLPNPADLPKSMPDRSRRQGLRVLFLGSIGIRKGAYDLIRAFGALPEDVKAFCHLTLAGDGDTDRAQTLAQELGCAKRVAIPGWIGKAAVERLLADSDVLVLPSYAEGMAMALVEAMSWGLPVVTTSVGGAGEFLEQGRNCLLVSPGDVDGIRDAIATLARDPEFRLRLGLAARDTISRFSVDTYISTLGALYEELAGSESGGSFAAVAPAGADRDALAPCSGGVSHS
jgi:glycosyltransferase involved in cell wall biosynthesis